MTETPIDVLRAILAEQKQQSVYLRHIRSNTTLIGLVVLLAGLPILMIAGIMFLGLIAG